MPARTQPEILLKLRTKNLDDPDSLASTLAMLKNPAARGKMEQVAAKLDFWPETIIRVVELIESSALAL